MKVWLPHPPEDFAPLPPGLDLEVYDGTRELPGTDRVEFYVAPYLGPPRSVEIVPEMASLRVVQILTAGVDNVLPYVPEGVTLCNAKGVHDASTAELAVGLILASLRELPRFVRAQDEGRWDFDFTDALAGKTVLIVGYGSVGAAVERRLSPFECQVMRVARHARSGEPAVAGLDRLAELVPRADVVLVVVPMTEETRGLVDARFLAGMADGALLVNIARGPVADTAALLAELESGRLRAAVDVTDPEPLPPDHPLWHAPGLLISPHVGGASTAFKPRAVRLVREQLERYVAGRELANVITDSY